MGFVAKTISKQQRWSQFFRALKNFVIYISSHAIFLILPSNIGSNTLIVDDLCSLLSYTLFSSDAPPAGNDVLYMVACPFDTITVTLEHIEENKIDYKAVTWFCHSPIQLPDYWEKAAYHTVMLKILV